MGTIFKIFCLSLLSLLCFHEIKAQRLKLKIKNRKSLKVRIISIYLLTREYNFYSNISILM